MLGNSLFRYFSAISNDVYGTVRDLNYVNFFPNNLHNKIRLLDYPGPFQKVISEIRPDVVINCIGIIKQHSSSASIENQIAINSLFPHQLDGFCQNIDVKLIQISTDCVFSGSRGMYSEMDIADAIDVYGKTKWLGELNSSNAITLRTSIIGHELRGGHSLINWFLSQNNVVKGYKNAIFSGLPTIELARAIINYVIPNPNLQGLYHISSSPIDKFRLLQLVAKEYNKKIEIIEDGTLQIDRSLDSSKFREATGYVPKSWPELIHSMHIFG